MSEGFGKNFEAAPDPREERLKKLRALLETSARNMKSPGMPTSTLNAIKHQRIRAIEEFNRLKGEIEGGQTN